MIAATSRLGLSSQDLWYLSRGSGLVLFLVLSAVVILGVAVRLGLPREGTPKFVVEALHRNLGLAAVLLLVIHVVTAILDPFVTIGWIAAVVPFTSPYRGLWIGIGAASFDLLVAVVLTSLLRAHLPYLLWKSLHFLAYASWPLAVAHSLGAGNDTSLWWVDALIWGATATTLAAIGYSLVVRAHERRSAPPVVGEQRAPRTRPSELVSGSPR